MSEKRNKEYDWHHRRPRSLGGTNAPENLSRVSCRKHAAWHTLFSNLPPEDIAKQINEVWIENKYRLVVERI